MKTLCMFMEEIFLQGAIVSSHHDHRIAMMCTVAALQAKGNTTICEADAINKSYPGFL